MSSGRSLRTRRIARQTVYNALNRRKNGQSILEDPRPGRPSSWTPSMKVIMNKIEETGKPPKRSESTQVRLQISQESNNYRSANTKIRYRGQCF